MSLIKKFMIALALLVAVAAILFFLGVKKIYTPTTGDRIAEYDNPSKALLVIDVQEDYTGLNGRQAPLFRNVESQIRVINSLIESSSGSGMHVVYIRQIFDNNFFTRKFIGRTLEGFPGTEIDSRIKVVNNNDFTKKISDAFSNQELEAFLIKNRVDELYLVGLDAAYCVYYTALGALNRGYRITVIEDAVMTRKDMIDALERYEEHGIEISSSKNLIGM